MGTTQPGSDVPAPGADPVYDRPGLDALYHVPRSQVWGGSRGRQAGNVHLHVTEDVSVGRLSRRKGVSLCGKRGWYERDPMDGEGMCPRCVEMAERYGFTLRRIRRPTQVAEWPFSGGAS